MATQTGSIDLTASNSVKLAAEAGWQSDLEDYATKAELDVQADRIGMVVANNDASSSLQLTADAMTYIGNNVTIKGTDGTSTVISGGQIQTGSLSIGAFDSAAQSATLNSNISVGGRNLLQQSWRETQSSVTKSGITYTCNADGSITLNGTSTEMHVFALAQSMTLSAGTYTLSGCPAGGGTNSYRLDILAVPLVSGTTESVADNGSGKTFETTGGTTGQVRIRVASGQTLSNLTFWPKLEKGNVATDWTPAPEDTPDQMTWYGTCSTAASTAEKAVACDGFELQTGARIAVKSTTANTANAPTLNVNGTGAIATWYNNAVSSSSNPIRWGANATLNFIYDGSVWVLDERPPSYSATCSTAAGTRAKAPSVVGALVVNGTRLSVRFSTANTYTSNSVQINLASTGAYSVYQNNAVTSTTNTLLWDANTILTFVAQGTYWHLLSRSDASETATSYVTEITDQNGIMVHPSTDDDTGVRITSDVDILRDGNSVLNVGTQGDTSGNTDAGVTIYDGTTNENVVATFDGEGIGLVGGAFRLTSTKTTEEWGDEQNPTLVEDTKSNMHMESGNDSYTVRSRIDTETSIGEGSGGYGYTNGYMTLGVDVEDENGNTLAQPSIELYADPETSQFRATADDIELNGSGMFSMSGNQFIVADSHNGVNMWSTVPGTVLWSSGGWHMAADQTANLAYNVSTCPTGIVLHWQPYTSSTVRNYYHHWQFIPKEQVASFAGTTVDVTLSSSKFASVATKTVYVSNNRVTGHADNTATGTANGITYANNQWVLTQIIAV